MEGIIIGVLLGLGMTYWGITSLLDEVKIVDSPVTETLLVAIYLTMLVGFVGFKLPVFFANRPRLSTFCLVVFAGHISLLFDSFAVVLLLAGGITFIPYGEFSRFNQFVVKVVAAFNALTVGGGFYLGELWGLPWFISNGQANLIAGFPVLIAATPVCLATAWLAAFFTPVKMEATKFDKDQTRAGIEFVIGLLIIIMTHSPILSIGLLFLYTGVIGKTPRLVKMTLHELEGGAAVALSLIFFALILTQTGTAQLIQPYLSGLGMFFGAMISSPFAGAIAPPVETLYEFYAGLFFLMNGAPVFVFSSLVAIMVFKETLQYEDLPPRAKVILGWVPGMKSRGYTQEALVYTIVVTPMILLLGTASYIAMQSGIIVTAAMMLGVTI